MGLLRVPKRRQLPVNTAYHRSKAPKRRQLPVNTAYHRSRASKRRQLPVNTAYHRSRAPKRRQLPVNTAYNRSIAKISFAKWRKSDFTQIRRLPWCKSLSAQYVYCHVVPHVAANCTRYRWHFDMHIQGVLKNCCSLTMKHLTLCSLTFGFHWNMWQACH